MDCASGRVFLIVFGVEELDFNVSEYEGRTCAFDKIGVIVDLLPYSFSSNTVIQGISLTDF